MEITNCMEELDKDIFSLGNHHYYGIFKETFEQRANQIISNTKEYLQNNDLSNEEKIKIKCWQFWLVGFLSGQKLQVHEQNNVGFGL